MSEYIYFNNAKINYFKKTIITGKLRTELTNIFKQDPYYLLQEKKFEIAIKLEIKEDMTEHDIGMEALKKGVNLSELNGIDENEYQLFLYKFFQVIIDIDKIIENWKQKENKAKLKELLTNKIEVNGKSWEFWQEQDIDFIEKEYEFFRKKINKTKQ